ncbi:MAG: baseplate J family protein [Halanaerobium sp. T82-1]|nr:MAG: baseplate J family protein [Halanaerobium sp. T82-1]
MAKIQELQHLPEINFVETDVETMLADAIESYEKAFYDQTGKKKTLAPGDPVRIWIYSQVLKQYQTNLLIDKVAKQNLLYYSTGEKLEHLAALLSVDKDGPQKAITTMEITLSAAQDNAVPIKAGTRVTPGNNIFFETTEYQEVPAGSTTYEFQVTCTEAGTIGNGFTAGQIDTLVDPIPYTESITNIDTSQNGAEEESDESLTRKTYLKPESFSVAGPEGAYIFFVKEFSQSIIDVVPTSPSPGVVDIRFILENGELPDQAIIDSLEEYLDFKKRRPLTDNVQVGAPVQVMYDIDLTYYISSNDEDIAQNIQDAVDQAISDYQKWQKTKIGRDINPDELKSRIKEAGAKRSVVAAPVFTQVQKTEVAAAANITINYGGLEDE